MPSRTADVRPSTLAPTTLAPTTTPVVVVDAQETASDAATDESSGPGPALVLGLLVVLVGSGAIVVARRTKRPGP